MVTRGSDSLACNVPGIIEYFDCGVSIIEERRHSPKGLHRDRVVAKEVYRFSVWRDSDRKCLWRLRQGG